MEDDLAKRVERSHGNRKETHRKEQQEARRAWKAWSHDGALQSGEAGWALRQVHVRVILGHNHLRLTLHCNTLR